MTKQLQVLLAVKALVTAALPAAEVLGFDGDTSPPELIGADGTVLGFPGDPGEPEIDLSPPAYNYAHEIPLQVFAPAGDGGAALDDMLAAIGAGLEADRTLGGLCSWISATAPLREDRTLQDATINWAEINIVPEYACSDPLA
jgi:hypothetical protein